MGLKSIKTKLVIMFVIAGAIPMLFAMRLINEQSRGFMLDTISGELTESVISRETILFDHIESLKSDAQILSQLNSISDYINSVPQGKTISSSLRDEALEDLIVFQENLQDQIHDIYIMDISGNKVLISGNEYCDDSADAVEQNLVPPSDTLLNAKYSEGLIRTTVTGFLENDDKDHFHQLVLSPIRNASGDAIGVVVFEIAIDFITELLDDNFVLRETGKLYLATTDGYRAVHLKSNYKLSDLSSNGVQQAIASGNTVTGWFTRNDNNDVFGAYHASRVQPWVVAVEIDRQEVTAPLRAQFRLFMFVSGFGLVSLAVLVHVIGRQFWNPLRSVVQAAEQVADGDVWHEFEINRNDEIGQLQGAVDSMRVSMKQQIDHLDSMIAERTVELEYANSQLTHDAENDRLTGLANRDVLVKALDGALEQFHEEPEHLVSVLFFDFDRFKVVNDSLGHATGDALLCSIAERFRTQLRETDLVARFGGDEFVVMISPVESEQHAYEAADRLLQVFEEPHIIEGHRIVSTASIGLINAHARYNNADEMIRDADSAMYEAKLAGKCQIVVFDEVMFEDAKRRLKLEEDLNLAISGNQLRVMYQPIILLEDMSINGFEALIRWDHPELGIVSPEQFIPIAEDTGQIVEIGAWILREACEQLARWSDQSSNNKSISMNVNVAKRQLIHPEFLDTVQEAIESTGIEPHQLKIEITESTVIDPRHDMGDVIDRVRQLGVLIAMDDFGTGHSSLSLLHQFDLDILKIDQSFVQGLENSREISAVLHSIIALAQNTGMMVVAEGAETSTQVACLVSYGCDLVQGFYFSKPMFESDATAFLQSPTDFRFDAA
ncbi:MAG: EAL domain-containing protein [Phycisphaerales bacterium]|nr:EAL domain-containing protein [Phycisphaerales bacterium]